MNQDILLSKIVPNPTDNTWTQAYTTLNVYITLSIEKETTQTPVTAYGKEVLEKLQREFFALDEKTLENIKKAVSNVTKNIEEEYNYSIIVGAISADVLYIVIASEGQVVIKRGEKVGVVATGVKNELRGFSGKLKHDDIIILETGDFNKKIPTEEISQQLESNDVLQIAENITPLIHESSKGTEGAIILQFKNLQAAHLSDDTAVEDIEDTTVDEITDEKPYQQEEEKEEYQENLWTKPTKEAVAEEDNNPDTLNDYISEPKKRRLPSISIPKINIASKKLIIIGAILLLVLVLAGGIFYQINSSNNAKAEAEFAKVYDPAKAKFDEAVELESLNKTLALEEFNVALQMTDEALANFNEGTSQHKRLADLKSQIQTRISELGGGGSAKNVREFVKTSDEIKSITSITAKGGTLLVLDSTGQQVATISEDGKIDKTYDIETNAKFISADDRYIYAMGDTVVSIDRGNGNVKEVMDEIEGESFDIFGSNLYTLGDGDVLKYVAPAYQGTSYFTDEPNFDSNPIDITISGPIFVLKENGSVDRFTRGAQDDFELNGLTAPISSDSKIYADPDLENIYIMDVKNQRVVVFNDEGEFVTQYEGSFIKGATSFAINEENEIGYVVKNNVVYGFDL